MDHLNNSEIRFQKFIEEVKRNKEEFEKIYLVDTSVRLPLTGINVTLKTKPSFFDSLITNYDKAKGELIPKSFLLKKVDEAVKLEDFVLAKKLALLIKSQPTEADTKTNPFIKRLYNEARIEILDPFGFHRRSNNFKPLGFKNDGIEITTATQKLPFTRVNLIDENELLTLLENYCESYALEPRHSTLKSVMERIETSFTRTLHESNFQFETFQRVNDKLKPFLSKISDFELFRRNVIFVSIYSELVRKNKSIKSNNLPSLIKIWIKWLVSNGSFKFIPICHFFNKEYPSSFSKEKLECIKYLHKIIVDELQYLNNPDILKLFSLLDNRILELSHYENVRTYRTLRMSSFEGVEKELLAFIYLYSFSTFQGNIDCYTIDLITEIMDEEGLESKYFNAIHKEMATAGLI